MKLNLLLMLLLPVLGFNQNQTLITKWQNAIINIEGHQQFSNRVREDISAGRISNDSAKIKYEQAFYTGTAIFLKDKDRHYLITAKHVIFDDSLQSVFNEMIIIPSVDNVKAYLKNLPSLMYISTGGPAGQSYVLSEYADVAIVSLDFPGKGPRFTKALYEMGYKPIAMSDIDFRDSSHVGDDIVCFGFPADIISTFDISGVQKEMRNYIADYGSLPITSFGKISMFHPAARKFTGDISIYPGNSGGPVISKGKLIGIISSQPTIAVESKIKSPLRVRVPFGYFEKAGQLKTLKQQVDKKLDFIKRGAVSESR